MLLAALAVLSSCGYKKGRIEGRVEYMDSNWDPSTPSTNVPRILVHAMPGSEDERREILTSYRKALGRKDPAAPDPSFVDHVISNHAPEGALIEAVEVDTSGSYALDGLKAGDWLVFAEYTTDLGHFFWMESMNLQGTRTVRRELVWDNRTLLDKPKAVETFGLEPPPYEAVRCPKLLKKYLKDATP